MFGVPVGVVSPGVRPSGMGVARLGVRGTVGQRLQRVFHHFR